jgi:hypothetical protein
VLFLPQRPYFPIVVAALFFNGALMLVAGIQIGVSRSITLRASLIIGLSVLSRCRSCSFQISTNLCRPGRISSQPSGLPTRALPRAPARRVDLFQII